MSIFHKNETIPLAHSRNAPKVLLAFLVLSTVAHGITFLTSEKSNTPQANRPLGTTMISAVLTPAKNNSPAHSATDASQASMPKKAKTISNTQHVDALNLAATHRNIPAQAIPLPQAIPSTQLVVKNSDALQNDSDATRDSLDTRRQKQTSAQRNYLLGEVQNRLSRYLTYPQRARRRGWQGEVMVAFQINTRGMLNNVHLAKSSGYSLLDQSAIAAISKLEKITLPEKLKPLQAMELLLPVSYQLREG